MNLNHMKIQRQHKNHKIDKSFLLSFLLHEIDKIINMTGTWVCSYSNSNFKNSFLLVYLLVTSDTTNLLLINEEHSITHIHRRVSMCTPVNVCLFTEFSFCCVSIIKYKNVKVSFCVLELNVFRVFFFCCCWYNSLVYCNRLKSYSDSYIHICDAMRLYTLTDFVFLFILSCLTAVSLFGFFSYLFILFFNVCDSYTYTHTL